MGVKAVFGALAGRAMCFGSHGDAKLKDPKHFQSARISAQYAAERPMLVTVGGGGECPPDLQGRVLNVAKVSKVYGETPVFYTAPEDRERLSRWPVATALLDVYEVEGFPRLVEDLGLPDRTILTSAFDLVVRPAEKVEALWKALHDVSLRLLDLPPLVNFREPDRVTLVGSMPPVSISKEEGQQLSKEVQVLERRSELARAAKALNQSANGGGPGRSTSNDGLLHPDEIEGLNIKADTVILSACETASGNGQPGAEALSGLAQAFLYAGSRTILATQWKVESLSAASLMSQTAVTLSSTPDVAERLRRSMRTLKVRKGYAHPAYWAPFVVVERTIS